MNPAAGDLLILRLFLFWKPIGRLLPCQEAEVSGVPSTTIRWSRYRSPKPINPFQSIDRCRSFHIRKGTQNWFQPHSLISLLPPQFVLPAGPHGHSPIDQDIPPAAGKNPAFRFSVFLSARIVQTDPEVPKHWLLRGPAFQPDPGRFPGWLSGSPSCNEKQDYSPTGLLRSWHLEQGLNLPATLRYSAESVGSLKHQGSLQEGLSAGFHGFGFLIPGPVGYESDIPQSQGSNWTKT